MDRFHIVIANLVLPFCFEREGKAAMTKRELIKSLARQESAAVRKAGGLDGN